MTLQQAIPKRDVVRMWASGFQTNVSPSKPTLHLGIVVVAADAMRRLLNSSGLLGILNTAVQAD